MVWFLGWMSCEAEHRTRSQGRRRRSVRLRGMLSSVGSSPTRIPPSGMLHFQNTLTSHTSTVSSA